MGVSLQNLLQNSHLSWLLIIFIMNEFEACMKDISSDFKYAIELSYVRKGKRSNRGRITCNLITKTVQDCGQHLTRCYSKEVANPPLNMAVESFARAAIENFDEWDSDKCPVVKDFMAQNRINLPEKNGSEMITLSTFVLFTFSFFMALNLMS